MRRGSPAPCATVGYRRRRGPTGPHRVAGRVSPWPCTPACPPATSRRFGRTGSPGSPRRGRAPEYWITISSNVRRMSSIIACSSPGHLGRQRHPLRGVAQILDAQRLRQPLRRVDRQDDDRPAVLRGAHRPSPRRWSSCRHRLRRNTLRRGWTGRTGSCSGRGRWVRRSSSGPHSLRASAHRLHALAKRSSDALGGERLRQFIQAAKVDAVGRSPAVRAAGCRPRQGGPRSRFGRSPALRAGWSR